MNCFFTRRIPLSLLCRGLRVPVSSCFAITLPLPIPPIHSFIHSLPYPLEKELENAFDSSYDSVFFTSPTHYFMSKVLKNFSFCLLPPPLLPPLHTHTHTIRLGCAHTSLFPSVCACPRLLPNKSPSSRFSVPRSLTEPRFFTTPTNCHR